MRNQIIKWLGGYTPHEYEIKEKELEDKEQENMFNLSYINLAQRRNLFFRDLDELQNYFDKVTTKKEIKYSAYTTNHHPTQDRWMHPRYSRPMHKYLEYDDEQTKENYRSIALSFLEELQNVTDGDSMYHFNPDDIVAWVYQKLYVNVNPEDYSSDMEQHGVTEMWESPRYLYENLWENDIPGDCDSYALFYHNVLIEALDLSLNIEAKQRLKIIIVELPNGTWHMLNMWMKGDSVYEGVGLIPFESTYYPEQFKLDWTGNRFIQKQRMKIIKGFDKESEFEWNVL